MCNSSSAEFLSTCRDDCRCVHVSDGHPPLPLQFPSFVDFIVTVTAMMRGMSRATTIKAFATTVGIVFNQINFRGLCHQIFHQIFHKDG
jgi:hypothetical protein